MNTKPKKPLYVAKSLEQLNGMLNIDGDAKKGKPPMWDPHKHLPDIRDFL